MIKYRKNFANDFLSMLKHKLKIIVILDVSSFDN